MQASKVGANPGLGKNSGIVRRRLVANTCDYLLDPTPDDTQDLFEFGLEASREDVLAWDARTPQLGPSVFFSSVRAVILGTRACEVPRQEKSAALAM